MIFSSVERWFLYTVASSKKGVSHYVLHFFSLFFRFGVAIRHKLFDLKVLSIYHSTKKVVSIGNICVGGSGKTSFTYLLAKEVARPVAIIERGYRASVKKKEPFIISSPKEGDEPFLLSQKLPFAKVIISKKRKDGAKVAEKMDVDYILLDDGMQHRYLARDIEVVMLHYQDIISKEYFLPRGFLRESPKRLKMCDYVVVNGVKNEQSFEMVSALLKEKTKAPLIATYYQVVNKKEVENKKVAAFCGIGKPDPFFELLESIGCKVVYRKILLDHEPFFELDDFKNQALKSGAEIIVCTEKDFVKLENQKNVIPIKIEMKILFGKNHFLDLVNQIKC